MTPPTSRPGWVLPALLVLAACQSTAPYTVPAAAINTALAAGVSATQRASGGCYAQCVGGTVCNPATGFCERQQMVCIGSEADSPACLARSGAGMGASTSAPPGPPPTDLPFGISPATGSVPPPPGSRP